MRTTGPCSIKTRCSLRCATALSMGPAFEAQIAVSPATQGSAQPDAAIGRGHGGRREQTSPAQAQRVTVLERGSRVGAEVGAIVGAPLKQQLEPLPC